MTTINAINQLINQLITMMIINKFINSMVIAIMNIPFLDSMVSQMVISSYQAVSCMTEGLRSILVDVDNFVLNLMKFLESIIDCYEIGMEFIAIG
jgi:anti-anti-sigma regulatory factor